MRYDLNIMGDPRNPQAAMRINNTMIRGPQKLIQRMVVLLFTDSRISTNLGIGTELSDDEIINLSDPEVVRNIYNIALASVKDTLLVETPTSADPSEKLQDAQLQVQETDERGKLELIITVTTQSGETATVELPVETIPEQENDN